MSYRMSTAVQSSFLEVMQNSFKCSHYYQNQTAQTESNNLVQRREDFSLVLKLNSELRLNISEKKEEY